MSWSGTPPPASGPPIFVVGCGRSGTTMLRLMLDAHSELAIPGESHFLITLWRQRRRYERDGRFDAEALVRDAMRSHQFRYWGIPDDAVARRIAALEAAPSFANAIECLYMAYADQHGKRRWGDKTPQYVRSIPELARIFDGSRFVHVVRDGRDVALSYLSLRWGPTNVWRAAQIWRRDVSTGQRAGRNLEPGRYLEVRYEELIDAPAATLERVCSRIGLTFEPVMLDYRVAAEAKMQARPDRTTDHASTTLPLTQGLRDWRTQMTEDQVLAFESVAGPLLADLGYERRFPAIGWTRRAYGTTRSQAVRPRRPGGRKIREQPKRRRSDQGGDAGR